MSAQISVYELLLDSAQTHASRPAFRQASGDVTYAALLHDVQCTARKLVHSGIQPGERIAVYAGKHYDTVVMFLAINAMGAVLVPINPQLKAPQVRHILLDSGACLFVSTGSRLKRHAAYTRICPSPPGRWRRRRCRRWTRPHLQPLSAGQRPPPTTIQPSFCTPQAPRVVPKGSCYQSATWLRAPIASPTT